jgi:hypothetical protein
MTLVMCDADNNDDDGSGGKYVCDNCRAEFPNKTTMDRHALFCRTLADIRRSGGGGSGGAASVSNVTHLITGAADDPLMPTPREMFILIQELAAKYNKVKDELDVMKQWAKMVGRRMGGGTATAGAGSGGAAAGLDFTSIGRQKRQNMEVILNDEDAEHPDLTELRSGFTEWLSSTTAVETDLNVVFNEDLVAGITAAILRVLAEYTAESGRSHLCPFKLADIKQGAFYIFDTAFRVGADPPAAIATDPPTPVRKWRAMEACEFQLLVRTFHKLLFKEFKKWQDRNWDAQNQMTKQRQKAASSYKQMMSSAQPPAMMSCDGMYSMPSVAVAAAVETDEDDDEAATMVGGAPLSEDFATLYNKYADKMMGGALSDEAILSRVRAKLWKDMKAWRL